MTVPLRSFCIWVKISAAPISMAICVSCPQACITPDSMPLYSLFTFEAKGTSTRSVTGKGIHVSAQGNDRSGLTSLENTDDPRMSQASLHFHAQALEKGGYFF